MYCCEILSIYTAFSRIKLFDIYLPLRCLMEEKPCNSTCLMVNLLDYAYFTDIPGILGELR